MWIKLVCNEYVPRGVRSPHRPPCSCWAQVPLDSECPQGARFPLTHAPRATAECPCPPCAQSAFVTHSVCPRAPVIEMLLSSISQETKHSEHRDLYTFRFSRRLRCLLPPCNCQSHSENCSRTTGHSALLPAPHQVNQSSFTVWFQGRFRGCGFTVECCHWH